MITTKTETFMRNILQRIEWARERLPEPEQKRILEQLDPMWESLRVMLRRVESDAERFDPPKARG